MFNIDCLSLVSKLEKRKFDTYKTAKTSYGEIRYIDVGPKNGEIILFSTGGGAGFNSVLVFNWLINKGYRLISVNRPGYYNLPLKTVNSIKSMLIFTKRLLKVLVLPPL